MYFTILSMARVWKIDQDSPSPAPAVQNPALSTLALKLPKIDITPFDGDIDKWPNFYALFDILVHKNITYSKVEKFTHLRSLLRGHALTLVENLPFSNTNYTVAYQTLLDRFQNIRLLGANTIDKILAFTPMSTCIHASLMKFMDVFHTNTNGLKALDIPNLFDFTILHIGLRSLPAKIRSEFENKFASGQQIPTFLHSYIQDQVRILEITPDRSKFSPVDKYVKPKTEKAPPKTYNRSSMMTTMGEKKNHAKCPCCHETTHKLFHYPTFKKFGLHDRFAFVSKNRLCEKCLGFHQSLFCRSNGVCVECKMNTHHSLLHSQSNTNPYHSPLLKSTLTTLTSASAGHPSGPSTHSGLACNADVTTKRGVLLTSAIIMIHDCNGVPRPVKALLDKGSQVSAISEACVQKLGLPRKHGSFGLVGLANSSLPPSRGIVYCSISSSCQPDLLLNAQCQVMTHISAPQPNFHVDENVYKRFQNLFFADPAFHKRSVVEFLLGADLFASILAEPYQMIKGEPSAFNTIFGWVIGGPVSTHDNVVPEEPTALLTCCEQLDTTIRRFWEIEEVPVPKPRDPDDVYCEQHFVETHSRDESGRFIVRLPFSSKEVHLPNTRHIVLRSLDNLEKRLKHNPAVFEKYRRYMNEFIQLGYMSPASYSSDYVIPHHCVLKDSSTTTKVRTVFNASFCNNPASSNLNEVLLRGPKLQKDICDILTNMRLGDTVICCDLRAMYLQVNVHPEERKFQHILYRPQIDGAAIEYEMNTLVFGIEPSAFLAQRCLAQLVADDGQNHPLASDAIMNQTFVDNICLSVNSLETAFTLQRELFEIFAKGGFALRKWASNRQEVLDLVPVDYREHTLVVRHDDEDHTIKILGPKYEPGDDAFSYQLNLDGAVSTKRGLMSEVTRIYDPLGWLAPLVFIAKDLIQQTWKTGLDWDDPLTNDLELEWERFHHTLPALAQLSIPRHIQLVNVELAVQILGFCDASEQGYAATIYLRTESPQCIKMYLITAKSRLAPLETVSVPRLELCGAVLLTKLLDSIAPLRQKVKASAVRLFTDSSTALAWIRSPPHKLKTHVSNRVVQIIERSQPRQWAHVRSEENPSDFTTRGLTAEMLVNCEMWRKGPPFAYQPLCSWTFSDPPNEDEKVVREYKTLKNQTLHIATKDSPVLITMMEKFSKLSALQHAIAHILRYIRNFKVRKNNS